MVNVWSHVSAPYMVWELLYTCMIWPVLWNPSITDTIGTSKLVLLIDVSFVEGSFNIIKYQNGTRKVSLVVRCPL